MRIGETKTQEFIRKIGWKNMFAVALLTNTIAFGHFLNWYEEILPGLYTVNRVMAKSSVIVPKQPPEEEIKVELIEDPPEEVKPQEEPILIEKRIAEVFGDEADIAIAVAMAESRLNPDAVGDTSLKKASYGLFQINRMYHNYTEEELLDPDKNIEAAKKISSNGRGWENWTTYRNGDYLKFYNLIKIK